MDKAASLELFLNNWNGEFPQYQLTATDMKEPHALIGALLQLLNRMGIDCDALLAPLPESERDEHTQYYWDLLPVINMTRVVNHLLSGTPQILTITIGYFLQPTVTTSHSILLLLFNLTIFNEGQLKSIAPFEESLFEKRKQVQMLEDMKNKLQAMLNDQAEEKGKRAERIEQIDYDIKQFEEELKQEKEAHDKEKQEEEIIKKEKQSVEVVVEQKRAHRDALEGEVVKAQALRVYDAEDVRAQAEQATKNTQDAEEKLQSLKETLIQKEKALKNLQSIKPNLDAANNYVLEIVKLSENLTELDTLEHDPESEGELEALEAEYRHAQAQLAELNTARVQFAANRAEAQRKRQEENAIARRTLEEAVQRDKKNRERIEKAVQRVREIKQLTERYEEEKNKGMEELMVIKEHFYSELKKFSDSLLKKTLEAEKDVESKLRKLREGGK